MSKINWYERSGYLLHFDYHAQRDDMVGRGVDPDETARLLAFSGAESYQIHAKGYPGYTLYPSDIGPRPDVLETDMVRLYTSIAKSHRKPFSCYYNIGRDKAIMENRPEWNRKKADGTLYPIMLCYNTTVVEERILPQLEEIITRYRPDGFWFDGSCDPVHVCYCEACEKKFRELTGAEAPLSPDMPLWDEFKEMQRQSYRDFVRRVTSYIKRLDPDCLVTFNFANNMLMPERDIAFDYLTGDFICEVDYITLNTRICDSSGIPFELMTGVWIPGEYDPTYARKLMKAKAHLEQDMARTLSCGGRFCLWDDPTREGCLIEENIKQAAYVVAPFMAERKDFCLGSVRIPDASVFYGAAHIYAKSRASAACFPLDYESARLFKKLSYSRLNFEAVTEDDVCNGVINSRLLILDDIVDIRPDAARAVIDFGKKAGTVLLSGVSVRLEVFRDAAEGFVRSETSLLTDTRALEQVLPIADRTIYGSLPEWVELVLREKGGKRYLHIVNLHEGARHKCLFPENTADFYWKDTVNIMSLPRVPAGTVSIRSDRQMSATLYPGGHPLKTDYRDGRVTIETPEIEVYAIIGLD